MMTPPLRRRQKRTRWRWLLPFAWFIVPLVMFALRRPLGIGDSMMARMISDPHPELDSIYNLIVGLLVYLSPVAALVTAIRLWR